MVDGAPAAGLPRPDSDIPRVAPGPVPTRYEAPAPGTAATVRLPRDQAYTPPDGYWEQIATELAVWLDVTASGVAEDLFEGDYAPFSAKVTAERAAAYYAELLFFPGGLPNPQAWERLYQTAGAQGLVDAVRAAERWRRKEGLPVYDPPPVEPGLPQGATPQGATPQGATPQGATPQGATPQGATPQGEPDLMPPGTQAGAAAGPGPWTPGAGVAPPAPAPGGPSGGPPGPSPYTPSAVPPVAPGGRSPGGPPLAMGV